MSKKVQAFSTVGSIRIGECGQCQPGQDSHDQEGRILRLRFGCPPKRDHHNPAPVERERDFRGDEIADEDANYVGNPFRELSTILRIQQAPPSIVAMPRPFRRRSPYFALDAQMLSFSPITSQGLTLLRDCCQPGVGLKKDPLSA